LLTAVFALVVAALAAVVFAHDTTSGALHQLPGGDGCITTDGLEGCSLGRHVKGAHAALPDAEGRTLYLSASTSPSCRPTVASSTPPERMHDRSPCCRAATTE